MRTREFLSELMRKAHELVRRFGFTMSEALKKVWALAKLRKAMKTRVVQFFYIKASTGELRQAFGTTDTSRYDYTPKGTGRNGNFSDCVQYWDCEKGGFRMFKWYNIERVVL